MIKQVVGLIFICCLCTGHVNALTCHFKNANEYGNTIYNLEFYNDYDSKQQHKIPVSYKVEKNESVNFTLPNRCKHMKVDVPIRQDYHLWFDKTGNSLDMYTDDIYVFCGGTMESVHSATMLVNDVYNTAPWPKIKDLTYNCFTKEVTVRNMGYA